MDRREILKYTAYLTGYAVAAPLASAILSGCSPEPATPAFTPSFFTTEAYAAVSTMADVMLPKTGTPGAIELGIPPFVDTVLAKYTEAKDQQRLRTGLDNWLAEIAKDGTPYDKRSGEDQLRLLNKLDTDAKTTADALKTTDRTEEDRPWWLDLKRIIIGSYFSSQYIGTEVLAYDPVPGVYSGCIPLSETNGKNWSL